jgi:hypothetical protein
VGFDVASDLRRDPTRRLGKTFLSDSEKEKQQTYEVAEDAKKRNTNHRKVYFVLLTVFVNFN